MKKMVIFVMLLLISIAFIPIVFADTLSYSLALDYDLDSFSLRNIELVHLTSQQKIENHNYALQVISFKDEILYKTTFDLSLTKFYSLPISKETVKMNQKADKILVNLLIPYSQNAKTILILKNNSVMLNIDVRHFSLCNENEICDSIETINSCPNECRCGNTICDLEEDSLKCSIDCATTQIKDNNLFQLNKWWYFLIAFILIIIIVFFLRKNKMKRTLYKSSNGQSSLKEKNRKNSRKK